MSNRITTTFVSQVANLPFADTIDAVEALEGRQLGSGAVRLTIGPRIGEGLAGAVWYSGVLRTGSPLVPSVRVDVVVSPWSAGRVEIGIRPLGRLGTAHSLRSGRFFNAAWAVMPALLDELRTAVPAAQPAPVAARAAA